MWSARVPLAGTGGTGESVCSVRLARLRGNSVNCPYGCLAGVPPSGGFVGLVRAVTALGGRQRGDSVGCLYGCCAGMPSAGVSLNWLAWLLRWDAISEGFAGLAHMVAALGGCQCGDSADCPYGCFAEVASVCRRRHADASQPAWDPHRGVCVGNRVESAIRGRRCV